MMRKTLFFICCALSIQLSAQTSQNAYQQRDALAEKSILNSYEARNIGPVVQGGRIVDIAVNEQNQKEYYVAYASGGVFKTENHGITFNPVFDEIDALGIGDIALAPSNPQIVVVGTGENNSSRSSYAGSGVYKSTDGAKTWESIGLEDTQHIGRVIIHPENPDVIWVASMGALYSHNEARGVYKTTDGGETWNKTLYVNDSTGIIDLVINPQNPDQLWASSWERTRKASNFKGNGPGSAIFRSDDGGNTWNKIVEGFPEGKQVGRIGLDVAASSPNIIYAFLDNQAETKEKKEQDKSDDLKLQDFKDMTVQQLLALDDEIIKNFLDKNNFPKKYTPQLLKKEIRQGKYEPKAVANYFGDANAALFNTSVVGAELYRSDDYGDTWKKMNSYDLDGVYFTYGYYFGEVRVAPDNPDLAYIFGVPLLKTTDGGETYARIDTIGDVHVDHQALWIDPSDSKHVLLGNDGGLYESYDEGANWRHINNMSVGQFYTVNVDMEKPYNVYGGLQDNGTLVGSSKSIPNRTAKWERIFGGDGMFVVPDARNKDIIYTGFQFGNYYRMDRSSNDFDKITPQHDIGEPQLRFNWRTPLKLSDHNQDIVYIGSQRLHRSFDKGDTWESISPDLTKNLPQGNVPFSTISTFSESPLKFGLIYVGTDDGNVQVTKSGGGDWAKINNGLPANKWVSAVFASPHNQAEVFVSLNGYREDDFSTYIYMSEDYGQSWKSLKSNLPDVVVNDLIQDPVNPNLLYLGTDHGTYISLNKGNSWEVLKSIPNVATYDLLVHPRDNELVVGTHGRSIFIVDAKPLQKIAGNADLKVVLFEVDDVRHSYRWGESRYGYLKPYLPQVNLNYFIENAGEVTFSVKNEEGTVIRSWSSSAKKGFNKEKWDVKVSYAPKKKKAEGVYNFIKKGKYTIEISANGQTDSQGFEVK
ncbi:glycosyl hydrolase [Fulvivirga sp. RKSG066]|uniref:WD40/YVTN/BNR-like repeat-containing protein n=1 Tax=Fulvivirga aurantia TaxID=2529383 RepID=UPI0012BBA222|nr:glycosyl hydrolase [Fulvivirga aurantia]MTI20204.1 glycosyl hydrolase [Fulvivirga aurantia]